MLKETVADHERKRKSVSARKLKIYVGKDMANFEYAYNRCERIKELYQLPLIKEYKQFMLLSLKNLGHRDVFR